MVSLSILTFYFHFFENIPLVIQTLAQISPVLPAHFHKSKCMISILSGILKIKVIYLFVNNIDSSVNVNSHVQKNMNTIII